MSRYGQYKDELYEQFARVGKAVCSAKRLELLDLLLQAERSVEELARETGMSVANTSQHLQIMKQARLIESERRGNFVVYRPTNEHVAGLLGSIQVFAEHGLAEVEAITRHFHHDRETMEGVDRALLLERAQSGDVIVLDVRPVAEFEAGHLPHAVSLPLEELEQRLSALPKDKEIVAYCRGPYCVLAVEAVDRLRQEGFSATRLEDGVREWNEHGLPVERSKALR